MDVHRARFVPYPVHAITAVAFSRTSDNEDDKVRHGRSQPTLRLAIGRDNGQIEIWNPLHGSWVQESVLAGDKSVDGLLWTREADETSFDGDILPGQYRLFSIASSPHVLEWDLGRGSLKRKSTGNFSEVWCFAAQPPQSTDSKTDQRAVDIVAGCGDGAVVLLSTVGDDLQFSRSLARVSGKKAKCISIAYQTRERVVAGFADSNIRILDPRNGTVLRTMSLGSGIAPAPKNKYVWKVKCLANGDIVSGDSNGDVVFWDGRTYSLRQRIKGHDSDCIDIVASSDGKTIFTGSLDGRIAVYHNSTNPSGRRSWAKTHHRRIHGNSEVKAMAAFDGRDMSIVLAGGSDLVPSALPLREYGKENLRALPHLPQSPVVASARHARLLVSWWDNCVSIWRIARPIDTELSSQPSAPRKLVGKIVLRSKRSIRDASISDDGRALSIATDAEVKVFHLRRRPGTEKLDIRALSLPESVSSTGARLLQHSPDGKWLAVFNLDNEVHMLRIAPDPEKPKRIRVLEKATELQGQNRPGHTESAYVRYERSIVRAAFSSDSCVLVAGELSGHLHSWVLEGHEDLTAAPIDITKDDTDDEEGSDEDSSSSDSDDDDGLCIFYGQHWTDNPSARMLPKLDSAPLVLSFRPERDQHVHNVARGNPGVHSTRHNPHAHSHDLPQGQHCLWVMTAQHQMYEFDVLQGRMSDWSRRNPTSALPEDFAKLRDRVAGAVWDVTAQRERLWLYGLNWVFMLNVGTDLYQPLKKRRTSEADADATFKRQKMSGAGGRTMQSHREGLSARMQRSDGDVITQMDLDRQPKPSQSQQGDPEDAAELQLTRLRSTDDEQSGALSDSQAAQDRKWWYTFKYRPILGMVPLEDDASTDEARMLEVVVVERPVWEATKSK